MGSDEPGAAAAIRPAPQDMRAVLGHFCTGIAVITGHDGRKPLGFTCQSVTSVSLDPPYVSFCPAVSSTSWPMIRSTGRMCINVLAAGQEAVCAQFARRSDDKFAGVDWSPAGNGAPRIHGALASIEADLEFEHGAGDHTIVVAHVTALKAHSGRPLLFYRGGYGGFADRPVEPVNDAAAAT
ncbi:flavin reductase family protein [Mycolicibacterium chlorophenolicum]|uniref:Flavin-dependent monooxygenase, reductase subunit HsaB n=1 Tax=Mycolicibacterium chlorophenolicum TaxID=37916 RepID=A0A0J6WHM2_9MYCO|nr:flavin reductase family protein [Mycolicibacterium chlorophenolicum]KMO82780.1 Flavin-dependent monooxygenase, reductase subunit HsaB [Mycolicibacterium chlorophenolicum]